jgi:hypothetical protein
MAYLHVDDGITYKHHADILNKLGKTKADGTPYDSAQKSVWEIKPANHTTPLKLAVFLYRAERSADGGWERPNPKVPWINIPDADEKIFTQIAINDVGGGGAQPYPKETQWAVFMKIKTDENTHAYVFYGIFTRTVHKDTAIVTFKRISPALDLAEWR